ncbi:hypothetical protein PSPO01_14361 [Paraphaeosphaeria sporulosa]
MPKACSALRSACIASSEQQQRSLASAIDYRGPAYTITRCTTLCSSSKSPSILSPFVIPIRRSRLGWLHRPHYGRWLESATFAYRVLHRLRTCLWSGFYLLRASLATALALEPSRLPALPSTYLIAPAASDHPLEQPARPRPYIFHAPYQPADASAS